jgi:CheY-like chemotaxis protein
METLASALDSSSSEPSDVRLPTHATTDTTNPLDAPIVLIAEDNAVNQLVAAEMVRKRGFRTVLASDGEAAVRILSHTRCAAVFMDCQMPLLDGYEATARIRAREGRARHTPIIALTAHALNGDRERCLGAGMDDYLAKPLRPDELGRVLARWLPAVAA